MSAPRLLRDVGWNVAALGVLAVSGLAINVVIGRVWGATVFGVFSQVLALYYIVSQLAAGGFPFAALYAVGEHAGDRPAAARRLTSALGPTAVLATVVGVAVFALSGPIGRWFDSPDVGIGLAWTLPGLVCFALNKTMLAGLNGLRMMRTYAAFNAARPLLILGAVLAWATLELDPVTLPASISLGELLLSPFLVGVLASRGLLRFDGWRGELARHVRFAWRGFPAGLLHDVNPKIDVLMLGLFASDRVVGIYAFAAMLVEGAYQLIWVLQTNVAPLVSGLAPGERSETLRRLVARNLRIVPPLLVAGTLAGWLLYGPAATLVTGDAAFADGRPWFAILMLGMIVASTWYPFALALNQWGRPGWFVRFLATLFLVNVVLNALLIPWLGATGAAIASATAFGGAALELRRLLLRAAAADG